MACYRCSYAALRSRRSPSTAACHRTASSSPSSCSSPRSPSSSSSVRRCRGSPTSPTSSVSPHFITLLTPDVYLIKQSRHSNITMSTPHESKSIQEYVFPYYLTCYLTNQNPQSNSWRCRALYIFWVTFLRMRLSWGMFI